LARDCPEESECYRCNQPGHIARYCLEESRSNDHRSRRNGLKECYLCQSTDHIQANCPSALCYSCRKEGHISRDCPNLANDDLRKSDQFELSYRDYNDNESSIDYEGSDCEVSKDELL